MKIADFKKGQKYVANATFKSPNYDRLVDYVGSFGTPTLKEVPTSNAIQVNKGDVVTVQYISKFNINGKYKSIVGLSNLSGISTSSEDAEIALYSDYVEPINNINTNNTKDNIKTTPAIWDSLQLASKRAKYLTIIGAIGGSAFAYYKKSSIWGYVGYAFLFSFGGSLLALASVKLIPLKTKTTPNNTNSNSINNSELTDLYVKMVNIGGQPKAIADLPKTKITFTQFENLLNSQEKQYLKDYFNGLLKSVEDIKNKTPEQQMFIMATLDKNLTDKYGKDIMILIREKASKVGLEL